ncbi:MAG: hypothetical protein NWQ39_15965 [Saprospiraceae bacterium]|nr:hypothetical protein [Saprospiraceae bacterium]
MVKSRRFFHFKVAIIFTLGLYNAGNGVAQGLSGSNGLFNIPVAYLPDDRQMTMGAHFLNKNYGSFKSIIFVLLGDSLHPQGRGRGSGRGEGETGQL